MNIIISKEKNKEIVVRVAVTPKKNKADASLYDLYLLFTIYENGINQFTVTISIAKTVSVAEWGKAGMKGTGSKATLINNAIAESLATAKFSLEEARATLKTCSEVRNEIATKVKTAITGKAPRGQKQVFQEKLVDHTIDAVMKSYLEHAQQTKGRQRQYRNAINVIHLFYKSRGVDTPLITNISTSDLQACSKWFKKHYRTRRGTPPKKNTTTTWFCQIGAVFVHATKRLKILPENPLPSLFRGTFENGEDREVLSEKEWMLIRNLDDSLLTQTEQVAKYCLLFEGLTGIDYCDLETLTRAHLKYDNDLGRWYIIKHREKTGELFRVPLSLPAKSALDKLRGLTVGVESYLVKLPSIEYSLRIFKQLARKAGVNFNITTKALRHTFAMNYMNKGGKLEDLQVMLGHRNISTTGVYGKISNQRLNDMMGVLEGNSIMHQ